MSLTFESIGEWSLSLIVIGSSLILAQGLKSLFRRVKEKPGVRWVQEMGPLLANLIYVIGIQVFLDVAPIHPKLALWIDSFDYVIGVLIVLSILRRGTLIATRWTLRRSSVSPELQHGFIPLIQNVLTLFVFFAGAIMILKRFNYDVMSLVTALGVGSLAVGLAARDTLSHMISGFTLIVDRNFKPGDKITVGDLTGDVDEIGLRSTRIRLSNGNTLVVPNSELVNSKILNLSRPTREKLGTVELRLALDADLTRARLIAKEVLEEFAMGQRFSSDRGRNAVIKGAHMGYWTLALSFWAADMDQAGDLQSDVLEATVARLRGANIPLDASPR